MKEYDVTIQETLEMTVSVEAESREEARRMVADRWKNGEYILDADSFKDVEFYPRGRSRDREERGIVFSGIRNSPVGNGMCMYQQASPFGDKRQLVRGNAP